MIHFVVVIFNYLFLQSSFTIFNNSSSVNESNISCAFTISKFDLYIRWHISVKKQMIYHIDFILRNDEPKSGYELYGYANGQVYINHLILQ